MGKPKALIPNRKIFCWKRETTKLRIKTRRIEALLRKGFRGGVDECGEGAILSSVSANESSGGYSVLVVEDEPNHQLLIRRELARLPSVFEWVQFARDADEAKRFASQIDFDCMLVDNRLPDHRGLDLIRDFARQGMKSAFVLMTSAGSEDLVVQAYRQHVNEYVIKQAGFWKELPALLIRVIEADQARTAGKERLDRLENALEELDASPTYAHSEAAQFVADLQGRHTNKALTKTEITEALERLAELLNREV